MEAGGSSVAIILSDKSIHAPQRHTSTHSHNPPNKCVFFIGGLPEFTKSPPGDMPSAYDAHYHPDRTRKSPSHPQSAGIREFLGGPLKGKVPFSQVAMEEGVLCSRKLAKTWEGAPGPGLDFCRGESQEGQAIP